MKDPDAHILTTVRGHFGHSPPARLAIAVSGGGDSVALMHILSRCFEPGQVALFAATVDHGLRIEARDEAIRVRDMAEALGITHTTLRWRGWDGTGNLQDQARRARYEMLSDWAKGHDTAIIALGHTADDQAETLLMRLARASGVNGLSGMPARRTERGVILSRPMLSLERAALREYLVRNQIDWSEDPSNQNLRFDRIKARQVLAQIAPLGIGAVVLSEVARNMGQAREALDWYSFLAARDLAKVLGGDVVLDVRQFRTLPEEIARRLLVRALQWIGGDDYPPRRAAVQLLLAAIREGRSGTLAGCRLVHKDRQAWICREFASVRDEIAPVDGLWDGRWRFGGPAGKEFSVRALGRRGLAHCPDWRLMGRPHAAAIATPAIWRGDELVAAPLAGLPNGWTAEVEGGGEEFFAFLLSH